MRDHIVNFTPLYARVKYSIDIADKTKGLLAQGSGAPNFLVFRSGESFEAYTNIGFIGQQMDLYFSANGLGSCWLGMAKPIAKSELPYVISMAFGKPAEPLHRSAKDLFMLGQWRVEVDVLWGIFCCIPDGVHQLNNRIQRQS